MKKLFKNQTKESRKFLLIEVALFIVIACMSMLLLTIILN